MTHQEVEIHERRRSILHSVSNVFEVWFISRMRGLVLIHLRALGS